MTQPGSSNFEFGPDSVAARLSVDVPPEGIQTLHQLSQETENLRTQMEALVRAEGDHIGMVQQMAEIHAQVANSTRGLTEEMSRLSSSQGMNQQQGLSPTYWGAPAGTYMDPFSGAGDAGMGRMMAGMADDPRGFINAAAQRGDGAAFSEATISQESMRSLAQEISIGIRQGMADEMRQMGIDPGALGGPGGGGGGQAGGQGRQSGPSGGRGGGGQGHNQPNSPDPDRDRLNQLEGYKDTAERLASRFIGEMGQGGSLTGMGSTLMEAMQSAGGAGGGRLGALFGAAGRAGPAGLAIGGALGGYALTQAGGEMVQDYANLGSMRGGGAGEGFGMEMAARSLAMNPFISTEQARQVIQGALSSGYQGKTFDTVTEFLSNNLTEMNMSVQDSMGMLHTNVQNTGESIEALSASLSSLKENSTTGVKTFEDLKNSFAALSETFSSAGMGPGTNATASTFANAFPNNQVLKNSGTVEKMAETFFGNPYSPGFQAMQNSLARQNPALGRMMPIQAAAEMGNMEPGAKLDAMVDYFRQAGATDADSVYNLAQSMGMQISPNEAQAFAEEISKGGRPGADAQAKSEAPAKTLKKVGLGDRLGSLGGKAFSLPFEAVGSGAGLIGGSIADLFSGNSSNIGNRWNQYRQGAQRNVSDMRYGMNEYQNPVVNDLVRNFGANGLEVFDAQGRSSKLDPSNANQIADLTAGRSTIKPVGSSMAPMQLKDAVNMTKDSVSKVSGEVAIKVSADPGLKVSSPPAVKISSHGEQAVRAYGGATPNNAPPGG